jgi:hypothetical protein
MHVVFEPIYDIRYASAWIFIKDNTLREVIDWPLTENKHGVESGIFCSSDFILIQGILNIIVDFSLWGRLPSHTRHLSYLCRGLSLLYR